MLVLLSGLLLCAVLVAVPALVGFYVGGSASEVVAWVTAATAFVLQIAIDQLVKPRLK